VLVQDVRGSEGDRRSNEGAMGYAVGYDVVWVFPFPVGWRWRLCPFKKILEVLALKMTNCGTFCTCGETEH